MTTPNEVLLRCYTRLLAVEKNLPSTLEVSERYAQEFLDVVQEIETITGHDLEKFKIPENFVKQVVAASSPHRKMYSPDKKCERTFLLMKIQGLLGYFQLRYLAREQPEIGFRVPE